MPNDAIIGYTGFVGSNLAKQHVFDSHYNSKNINRINGKHFSRIVCAGAPGTKWLANKNPDADYTSIKYLMNELTSVTCEQFILISTVDVFKLPVGVDEKTDICKLNLHPYGLHRLMLEEFVQAQFPNHLIVRLPGLVGPGLKKNVIYDFQYENETNKIDSRAIFQFYPLTRLWSDIINSLESKLKIVHLTSEPISVAEIALNGFKKNFNNPITENPAKYDFRTCNGAQFGKNGNYQYCKNDVIAAIHEYIQNQKVS